jgi:hypothetical protein
MYARDAKGRTIEHEGFEIYPLQPDPLILEVCSPSLEIASRIAFLLGDFTRGRVMLIGHDEWANPQTLIPQMGKDFDLAQALQRFEKSRYQKATLNNPYPD